jgi:hypothetical protein
MALDTFVKMYLDYRNNFLTVEAFAAHYSISVQTAEQIVIAGRLITSINL